MSDYLSILLIGGAFFAAVAVLLTAEPKVSRKLTAIAGVIALIGGLLMYGYGYMTVSDGFLQAMLHTVLSVCRMFVGEPDFGDICEAPLFGQVWAVTLGWCVHVLAFYATSSAAISLIGANALKNLRIRFSRKKGLSIIYGVNEDSVAFGQALAADSRELIVYVAEDADPQLAEAISQSGSMLRADSKAVSGSKPFLKSLGIRKGTRKITLYALSKDFLKNTAYAKALLGAFEQRNIPSSQLSLVIHAREDEAVKRLQVTPDRFGYGFVTVFLESDLTARLLIQKHPPCHCMTFDGEGAAMEDFEVLVIGFGKIGQTVLRNITMNAQFADSQFRADIFSPEIQETSGFFMNNYPGMFDNYHLEFHCHNGRSQALYAHLNDRLDKIKYIVVCTGSDLQNEDIAEELQVFLRHKGKNIPIHQCSHRGVRTTDPVTAQTTVNSIYHPDVLSTGKLDAMAMAINQYYIGSNSKGLLEDWMDCDYFSRKSCRAFADSIEAVLRAAGKTREQAIAGLWNFSDRHLENLGRMEHARWNAFHFCMGFVPMSQEEYEQRTQLYREQVVRDGKSKIRIGKNPDRRTHACLISWEALDGLSEKENSITGKSINYKQMDIDNIQLVPKLLQILEQDSKRRDK